MAAAAASYLCLCFSTPVKAARFPCKFRIAFAIGSPLVIRRSVCKRNCVPNLIPASIRCEQSNQQGGGLDLWIGRAAMVSFVIVVTIEIATGKGPLENLGIPTPLPIVVLALAVLVATLMAYFIF